MACLVPSLPAGIARATVSAGTEAGTCTAEKNGGAGLHQFGTAAAIRFYICCR
jgi:hypothetical protein